MPQLLNESFSAKAARLKS